jgi:glyoxylase-like metal-dependent hydrolase (beta-lactamase superfamily II)
VKVGEVEFAVRHCPGHSPGHVVFLNEALKFGHVGDVLFQGSIGRTDFEYGDHDALISAIKTKLLPLPDDFTFICGHGPASTIGAERKSNPFLPEVARLCLFSASASALASVHGLESFSARTSVRFCSRLAILPGANLALPQGGE